ncbi:MAG: tetratricopeptide repeat protein [Gemmatimonadetes bacterium]|nr:tetratricopeptide repeat protein [Gemmatimonadota bacterium]
MSEKRTRRLSAIMFTDIVGYTALMQEDESRATTLRDRHRTVLRERIEARQGKIVQFYGDGTLSVFPSAVQAVDAAVDIQRRFQLDPPIPVRIGLHIGDIVHDQDGVHGDGVNVAARVQELAVPGSVLISGTVCEELKNHPRLPTRALGDFELKNVQRPLGIHAVAASGLAVPAPADLSSSGNRTKKSIAVLPFVNMSSDLENEYFTDGITEEILNTLVKFDDLKVTARTSSFVFKGKHEDVREIGRALNVGAVLEGSVRKAGNRVRITAQLVDTADGYHLFSNSYDRVLEDIFAVQDEIAHTIARELRVLFPVAVAQAPTMARKPTESTEAYSLYLRGLHRWNQGTPNTTKEALGHFRDALALDPDFALAHTGVARCYVHLGTFGRLRSEEAYPAAQEAAQRAIELDPEIAMGHVSLGLVKLFYDWDLPAARSCLERAIELNPGSAEARHWAGYCYMASGHFDEFLETAQVAASLDPLSLHNLDTLGTAHLHAGSLRDSLIHYDRALEIDPTFRTAIEGRALAYDRLGEHDRAIEEFLRYRALTPGGVGGLGTGAYIFARAGRTEEALGYLAELEELERTSPELTLHFDFTVALTALGRIDEAVERLERAIEARNGAVVFVRHNFAWDDLPLDPRMDEVLAAVGL